MGKYTEIQMLCPGIPSHRSVPKDTPGSLLDFQPSSVKLDPPTVPVFQNVPIQPPSVANTTAQVWPSDMNSSVVQTLNTGLDLWEHIF